ncbi:MAG: peptidoglycan editing factor PgeF [Bacteroidales bacterium]|nr:peptidoglycan editing factor PgeF [Bacteroidales bacterium]
MKLVNLRNTQIGRFDIFEPYHELTHFITTRLGGFSNKPYHELNLGYGTDDDPDTVTRNRFLLAEDLGIPLDWFVFPRQTHSSNVYKVVKSDRGLGSLSRDTAIPDTDALITNERHICIVVQVADCVPILIFDPVERVIAVAHAGWRGTSNKIVSNTIQHMRHMFGCRSNNLIAAVGPSIHSCCYQVGEDVYEAFGHWNRDRESIFSFQNHKLMLNLPLANRLLLLHEGVPSENISISDFCTYCRAEYFYSSRHGKGQTGRFVAGMMLW